MNLHRCTRAKLDGESQRWPRDRRIPNVQAASARAAAKGQLPPITPAPVPSRSIIDNRFDREQSDRAGQRHAKRLAGNDSKAGDIALCAPTRNGRIQSDTKFYRPVGCTAVLTCGNLPLN
jgi:hypothetical protein